jgi:multiple sugar transport system permease protein
VPERLGDLLYTPALALPGLAIYIAFVIVPVVLVIGYSLTNWNGFNSGADFVGLENYRRVFVDTRATGAIMVTAAMAVAITVVLDVLGLGLAVILNRTGRVTRWLRALFFFPLVLAPVVVAFAWKGLLNYGGVVNQVFSALDLPAVNFLGEPSNAIVSMVIVQTWWSVGFPMVLYLAALQGIPRDLMEAARIDGASAVQEFAFITLPLMRSAILIVTSMLLIIFMRTYELVIVLTYGGPGGATETIGLHIIRRAITESEFAYGSALAVTLFIILVAIGATTALIVRRLGASNQ